MCDDSAPAGADRPLRRSRGGRRVTLPPKPGTDSSPYNGLVSDQEAPSAHADTGPNDVRLREDVPPHY
ncbi:hypothetical protein [Rathayibacter toxicus]|uniref:Uncharacterized protein n=1 Tax=Rathayibacter toxicus TaxID=145458 RepID=A0A2S5Y940_9MICO|nr:hypothetical protein [Rathayibacter toxicus]PPG23277.1 hypothetical protein C5D15_03305 [Rathayibacter toxicus]PPG47859.1 hypothetical protein C5D16_03295 [Rathayibacter toxicus]PPH25003.1 hypothetical protein C5D17_03280 [Rathayibacter toxicus]PPH58929.1 hypothetical protein C5D30_03300 [Rathayibacter toxicus]PPH60923.1 hypothetical protein C5C93_03330 [Rathayibacter toxicus]